MRTYKVRVEFQDREQESLWKRRLLQAMDCYNAMSETVFREKTPLTRKSFHDKLYREARERFGLLTSQMCIQTERAVLANYLSARSNGVRLDRQVETRRPSMQLDQRTCSRLTADSCTITDVIKEVDGKTGKRKLAKRKAIRFRTYPKFRELASTCRMTPPKLTYDPRTGVVMACVAFKEPPAAAIEGDSVLGVDLGMRRLATLSDGTAYTDRKYLGERRKVRYAKRALQSHRKTSHSARAKLSRLRRREFNLSKDMCHRLTNEILTHDGNTIALEDLTKIKRDTSRTKTGFKRKRHNSAISKVPFYQIRQMLAYKAPLHGKRVATVSPEFTSRIDSRTGSAEGCARAGCRFVAADGRVLDADWNAAVNIA